MFVVCFLIANIAIISITSKLSVEKDKDMCYHEAKSMPAPLGLGWGFLYWLVKVCAAIKA